MRRMGAERRGSIDEESGDSVGFARSSRVRTGTTAISRGVSTTHVVTTSALAVPAALLDECAWTRPQLLQPWSREPRVHGIA